MKRPNEPLALSAPLARQLAPQLCRRDPATGEDCSWHHGFWQYLRLLGLASTPAHHADFYWRAFQAVTGGKGAPRVLVCGGSDYSMLAHVLAAFRERGVEPEVTVIDVCDTPLHLNRWYAARVGCRIESLRCNALDYSTDAPFDLVCTHSFFSFFSPTDRRRLVARWRQLLRPEGLVVTVSRVRPNTTSEPVGFTPCQAQAFRTDVLNRAEAMRDTFHADPADLARQAETYAGKQFAWPVRSHDEIRELFERSNFRVDELSTASATAAGERGVTGVAVPGTGEHAQIIASRL